MGCLIILLIRLDTLINIKNCTFGQGFSLKT